MSGRMGSPSGRRSGGPGPAEFGCLGQPVEGLLCARELDDACLGPEEREQGVEHRRLPDVLGLGGDDDRNARLDQQPERRRQFRVESAFPDQRDDRAIGGTAVGHGPSVRAGRGPVKRRLASRRPPRVAEPFPGHACRQVGRSRVPCDRTARSRPRTRSRGPAARSTRTATSAGRENGRIAHRRGAGAPRMRLVRTRPGCTALAVTPVPSSRRASSNVNRRSAALDAPNAESERNRRSDLQVVEIELRRRWCAHDEDSRRARPREGPAAGGSSAGTARGRSSRTSTRSRRGSPSALACRRRRSSPGRQGSDRSVPRPAPDP